MECSFGKTTIHVKAACWSCFPIQKGCLIHLRLNSDFLLLLFSLFYEGEAVWYQYYYFDRERHSFLDEWRKSWSKLYFIGTLPKSIVSHSPYISILFERYQMINWINYWIPPVLICLLPFKGSTFRGLPRVTLFTYFCSLNSLIIGYWRTSFLLVSTQIYPWVNFTSRTFFAKSFTSLLI